MATFRARHFVASFPFFCAIVLTGCAADPDSASSMGSGESMIRTCEAASTPDGVPANDCADPQGLETSSPASAPSAKEFSVVNVISLPYAGKTSHVLHKVTERYYDVSGDSLQAVREDMNQKHPTDDADKQTVDALTFTHDFWWQWEKRVCALDYVHLSTIVDLPRYVGSNATVKRAFDEYMIKLKFHEYHHVDIARKTAILITRQIQEDMVPVQSQAVEKSNCAIMNDKVDPRYQAALKMFLQENAKYDVDTRHGRSEGACFPSCE
jgi:predicted secreted Zn-dependent protease